MLVQLLNYADKRRDVELPDDIKERKAVVSIDVIFGDEVISVDYGDGSIEKGRADFAILPDFRGWDGSYDVYNIEDGVDLLSDPAWQSRKNSYEFLWGC